MEEKRVPPSEIAKLVKHIRDNKFDNDPRIVALLNCVAADPDDIESYNQLWLLLQPKMIHDILVDDPFRPEPEANEVNGLIQLGNCYETNADFGLLPKELMQGMLIAGRPGAGKTTLCYKIIEEANRQGINCLMLDLKQDYRHLIRILPNTLVFRCEDKDSPYLFKWNPLEPPVTAQAWVPAFSDVTAESYFFYAGTSSFIMSQLFKLYREANPEFPSLIHFQKWIEKVRMPLISRDSRYKESALNRLEAITSMAYKTLNCRKGYNIESLLEKHNVVIELDSLGTDGRSYFVTLILAHIFQSRILNRKNAKPILVIIDEANEIFNREVERRRGNLRISSLAREAREFMFGMVASCQLPEAVCNSVKNCYTRVMMSLADGENLRNFSQSLGLTNEQREIVWKLQSGQAIARFVRYPNPFVVMFKNYPLEKNVSDEELAEHMENFSEELGLEKEKEEYQEQKVDATALPPTKSEEEKPQKKTEEIKPDEKEFLMAVYLHPFRSITERYKNLNLSAGKGNRIMKALIRKQLAEIVLINLGGRGGLTKFLNLTEKASEIIGMPVKKHIGKGTGFEHEFWQTKISEHFKNLGYKTEIEKNLDGKFIDIAVETEKGIIAIEIAMTPEHEKINIAKDLTAGCTFIIVACKNEKVLEEVESPEKNIFVCLAYQLLRCKSPDEITNVL